MQALTLLWQRRAFLFSRFSRVPTVARLTPSVPTAQSLLHDIITVLMIMSAAKTATDPRPPTLFTRIAVFFLQQFSFLPPFRFCFLRLFRKVSYSFFLLVLEPLLAQQKNGPKEKGHLTTQTQKTKPTQTDCVGGIRGWRRGVLRTPPRHPTNAPSLVGKGFRRSASSSAAGLMAIRQVPVLDRENRPSDGAPPVPPHLQDFRIARARARMAINRR